jgi:chemotaxis protein CheD
VTQAAIEQTAATVVLGLGDWRVTTEPGSVLSCLGLGSCVAFAVRDPVAMVAGMAHMVLPESTAGRGGGAKFVDIAIALVLEEMQQLGAVRHRLRAYLVGGAQMLTSKGVAASAAASIGGRNIEAARTALAAHRLKVAGEDLGGSRGRTVRLDLDSGELLVAHTGEAGRAL